MKMNFLKQSDEKRDSLRNVVKNVPADTQSFTDNRGSTAMQRQLKRNIANSQQAIKHRIDRQMMHDSSRMKIQRKILSGMSYETAPRADSGELLRSEKTGKPLRDMSALPAHKTLQRVRVSEALPPIGLLLLEKHMGTEGAVRAEQLESNQEVQENALEAVYYQRPKNDRREVNTVFFVNTETLRHDLNNTNSNIDLDQQSAYSQAFSTTDNYFAISVLRVWKEGAGYVKAKLSYGDAKPVVKLNKQGGVAWNHLQETNPKKLTKEIDLIPKKN